MPGGTCERINLETYSREREERCCHRMGRLAALSLFTSLPQTRFAPTHSHVCPPPLHLHTPPHRQHMPHMDHRHTPRLVRLADYCWTGGPMCFWTHDGGGAALRSLCVKVIAPPSAQGHVNNCWLLTEKPFSLSSLTKKMSKATSLTM